MRLLRMGIVFASIAFALLALMSVAPAVNAQIVASRDEARPTDDAVASGKCQLCVSQFGSGRIDGARTVRLKFGNRLRVAARDRSKEILRLAPAVRIAELRPTGAYSGPTSPGGRS